MLLNVCRMLVQASLAFGFCTLFVFSVVSQKETFQHYTHVSVFILIQAQALIFFSFVLSFTACLGGKADAGGAPFFRLHQITYVFELRPLVVQFELDSCGR